MNHRPIVAARPTSSSRVPTKNYLCEDQLVLIVLWRHAWARRRTVSLRHLNNELFIHREPGSTTRPMIERRMSELGIGQNVTMELGSNEAISRSVEMGNGVSLLSGAVVASVIKIVPRPRRVASSRCRRRVRGARRGGRPSRRSRSRASLLLVVPIQAAFDRRDRVGARRVGERQDGGADVNSSAHVATRRPCQHGPSRTNSHSGLRLTSRSPAHTAWKVGTSASAHSK